MSNPATDDEDDVGGYWLAPVRLTERMISAMLPEIDCEGTREDMETMVRNAWSEARFASPKGGRKTQT